MNSSVIEYRGEVFTKTTYNDISVIIDSDGYYNASKICSDNDTQYTHIARNQYWTSYVDTLQRLLCLDETPYIHKLQRQRRTASALYDD